MSHTIANTCVALSVLLAGLGCSGDDSGGPDLEPVLRVEISSAGGDLDLDGYTVAIDGGTPQAVELNDVQVFEGLEPGLHIVELDGVAGNCVAGPRDIRSVTLTPGDTAFVAFTVLCTVNGVSVTVTTTGLDLDLFYHLVVDGVAQQVSFSAGAPFIVSRLTPGPHLVRLAGVEPNCRAEPEQHTVNVIAASTIPVAFVATCVATTAVLRVTVTTGGEDRDPSGYTVGVSGKTVKVKSNDVGYLQQVPAGNRSVSLRGVANNCTPNATDLTVNVVAGRLVRDTVDAVFEVFCVRGWEVAFTRYPPRPDPYGVHVGRLDGSMVALVTQSTGKPAWSPDGEALSFSCGQVCVLRLDGSPVTTLPTGYSTGGVSWSLDGTRLVFGLYTCPEYCYYNEEFQGLTIVRVADGSDPRRIPLPADVTWASNPDWSPDGATIAFECWVASGPGVCIVHPDGSGFRRLTDGIGSGPAWSPDGSRIAFYGTKTNDWGHLGIWVMNADGTGAREVAVDARTPDWTRDGQRIVFSGWRCTDNGCQSTGLEWVRPDGSDRVRLTSEQDYDPAIRP